MKRKALSLILAFAMAVSLFTVGASAAEPTYGDTAGHWAEASIERWSGYGIIQGSNGKFDPDGQLTCAQLATILARLLKLPAAKDAGFIDNPADAWYYDAINRCAAAGILKGNGDGTVTPNASITRERAMVMLARALGIEPLSRPDLSRYADAAQVSPYAQGYLAALIEAGIVGGVTADRLAPQDNITRAATVTILDRAIQTYADKAGAAVSASGGLVLVVADDVTVSGTIGRLLIPTDNIVVTVSGSKNIGSIAITGNHSTVILDNATADDVTISGVDSKVETKNGSHIKNIALTESASGAVVAAGSGTTIDNVANSAPGAAVTGSGTVKSVASDTDVTVETKNTEVKNTGRSEITVTDAKGKETTVKPGTSTTVNKESASSSGSSGGSYTPPAQHTHTWNAGVVTKEPTCTEAGVKTYTCTTCGATKTEEIPATGHTWGDYEITHAVSGRNGTKTRTCSRCDTTESAPLLYKFYLGIESGSTVDMTVGEDYTAVFTMPAAGGTVNTDSIALTAKMQDVASLGVEGVKSHTTTISTGLGGTDVTLNTWLPNCYNFEGATINATIGDKSCTYTLDAIDKADSNSNMYTITATTDPAAASAAWQALTSHVTAGTQADDSKIVIKNGAYLMIGTEKLEFTSSEVGDLTLDNFNNMNALNETIRNHVKLSTCDDQGGTITAYLPAGTTLAVGSSVATLKDNCTITITLDADEMGALSTALSSLKSKTDATMMVKELVQQFDNLVGVIDATGNVTVIVSFSV
ncbi:S-layer homology domain-containing protein [Hominicoprocola fusiformis]